MSTPKPKSTPEARLEARFVRKIEALGGIALKLEVKGQRGWPDRLCILPHGVTAYVEVKAKNGMLSEIQKERIKQLEDYGHYVFVFYNTEQMDMVIETLVFRIASAKRLTKFVESWGVDR